MDHEDFAEKRKKFNEMAIMGINRFPPHLISQVSSAKSAKLDQNERTNSAHVKQSNSKTMT